MRTGFITIMNPGGIRYTHPNPALIGHKFFGNTAEALTGSLVIISARLRRQTRGIAPDELRGMFEYYQAILHSIREGLVLLDREGRVVLCNDAARELLGLSANPQGLTADALGLTPGPDCVSGVPPGAPGRRDLRGRHQGVSDQHRSSAVTRPRDGKCGDRARPHRVAGTHR
jgi:sensor histidine kinase regulating citrate/malate metabolism